MLCPIDNILLVDQLRLRTGKFLLNLIFVGNEAPIFISWILACELLELGAPYNFLLSVAFASDDIVSSLNLIEQYSDVVLHHFHIDFLNMLLRVLH